MSSDGAWSLAFFHAPVERVLPWIAGSYLAADRVFRAQSPVRRWLTSRPKLRVGGTLDLVEPTSAKTLWSALRGHHAGVTPPVRFGPATGTAQVTLVEGPNLFDIHAPDEPRHLSVDRIAAMAGADFFRMGWQPDLMTLMATRAEGRPRHIAVFREAGRWHRRETGRPLDFEEPGVFGGPVAGAAFSDAVLRHYLGKIAPGLAPEAGILASEARLIGGGVRGQGLRAYRAEADRLSAGRGLAPAIP